MNKSKVAREKAKEVMNLIRAHSTKDNVLAGGLLEFTEQQIKRVVSQAQTEILDKAIEVAENEAFKDGLLRGAEIAEKLEAQAYNPASEKWYYRIAEAIRREANGN